MSLTRLGGPSETRNSWYLEIGGEPPGTRTLNLVITRLSTTFDNLNVSGRNSIRGSCRIEQGIRAFWPSSLSGNRPPQTRSPLP
jgi:hypothetical protein